MGSKNFNGVPVRIGCFRYYSNPRCYKQSLRAAKLLSRKINVLEKRYEHSSRQWVAVLAGLQVAVELMEKK